MLQAVQVDVLPPFLSPHLKVEMNILYVVILRRVIMFLIRLFPCYKYACEKSDVYKE